MLDVLGLSHNHYNETVACESQQRHCGESSSVG